MTGRQCTLDMGRGMTRKFGSAFIRMGAKSVDEARPRQSGEVTSSEDEVRSQSSDLSSILT